MQWEISRERLLGAGKQLYRSGLVDSVYRLSVNLKGGPAMPPQQFVKWHQKILLGASLKVVAPTGQYDPTKLINWGANRWSFKPEFGYSERWGHWVLDGYAGVWFFTKNPEFFSHNAVLSRHAVPIAEPYRFLRGPSQLRLRHRLWCSLDGNYWFGGKTSLNGVENPLTDEKSSRIGGTASIPVSKHESLKFSYNNGDLYPVWRELPKRLGGLAVFLAGATEIDVALPWDAAETL